MIPTYFTEQSVINPNFNINAGINSMCVDNGNGYAYAGFGSNLYKINLNNNQYTTTIASLVYNTDAMTIMVGSSGIIANSGNTGYQIFSTVSGYLTQVANASFCYTYSKPQQIACNPTGVVFSTSSNASTLLGYSTITNAASSINLSGTIGSSHVVTVALKSGSNNFLIGTDNGQVVELDQWADVIKTYTLPTPNLVGNAPQLLVYGLSYYNDSLIVSTTSGLVYTVQWSTGAVLDYKITKSQKSGNAYFLPVGGGLSLCDAPSGLLVSGPLADNPTGINQVAYLLSFNASGFDVESYSRIYFNHSGVNPTIGLGIDYTSNKCAIGIGWETNIHIFSTPSVNTYGVQTRAQYPVGTDVGFRVIRIQDNGPGTAKVVIDKNEPAGTVTEFSRQNARYFELAIYNNTLVDFRRFDL